MIDHTGVIVSDFARSRAWYEAALSPIGYAKLAEFSAEMTGQAAAAGFGEAASGKADFWIGSATSQRPANHPPIHVAFRVRHRSQVDAFHAAAVAAGGTDNGAPGPRPHYHPNYYGAFVCDPDGHNIEAVCHEPI